MYTTVAVPAAQSGVIAKYDASAPAPSTGQERIWPLLPLPGHGSLQSGRPSLSVSACACDVCLCGRKNVIPHIPIVIPHIRGSGITIGRAGRTHRMLQTECDHALRRGCHRAAEQALPRGTWIEQQGQQQIRRRVLSAGSHGNAPVVSVQPGGMFSGTVPTHSPSTHTSSSIASSSSSQLVAGVLATASNCKQGSAEVARCTIGHELSSTAWRMRRYAARK